MLKFVDEFARISPMLMFLAIFVILPEFKNKFSRILGAENLKG